MTTHSECLKSRPETVGEVEPDGYNPNEVEHHEDGVGEGVLDPSKTVSWRELPFSTDDFCPHHVSPEIFQVKDKTETHDDAKHQHILACPFHSLRLVSDSVLVVTTGLPVLEGEDEGVNNVNAHQGRQGAGSRDGIPVGAEQFTNLVVRLCTKKCHYVHASMKRQEENQCQTRHRHDHFPSD